MISVQDVLRLVLFEKETGHFKWKVDRCSAVLAGSPVYEKKTAKGYIELKIKGKRYYAHRIAWVCATGDWPENQIDHINGDKTDNRLSNLRDVTHALNQRNRPRVIPRSGIIGVSWNKKHKAWYARIGNGAAREHLGFEKGLFEAACLRRSAENRLGYTQRHREGLIKSSEHIPPQQLVSKKLPSPSLELPRHRRKKSRRLLASKTRKG